MAVKERQAMEKKNSSSAGSNNEVSTKTKVLIVDDHAVVREGLTALINHEQDMTVCGQAEDAHEAMSVIKSCSPDVVVVDISLKSGSGIELIKDIKIHFPDLAVLTLSMHDESLYAERALRAGARGYVMKQQATENVITAIRRIADGQLYISDRMASRMVSKLVTGSGDMGISPVDTLSDRELEVFLLIGRGYGTRQISDQLHLSSKTIETYRAHIKDKLKLASAAELLQYAIQWAAR
jgi:DNA-binding NarL/FixJ family response regulator